MTRTTSGTLTFYDLAVVALIFFSVVMTALVTDRVFQHLPHLEDEMAYLYQARIFARGDVVIDSPQPSRAFWQPFVIDYAQTGNRFGKYSPGWPALLAIGELMGRLWVVNAFCAAGTVALTYRLGREVFNRDVGLIAAALVAFSPMALLLNGTLMGHTSALFCAALFMYAIWRIERGRRVIAWGVVAGIALGLLIINRPLTAIGVALPFVLWSGLRVLLSLVNTRPFRVQKRMADDLTAPEPLVRGRSFLPTLVPLVLLSVIALTISAAIPLFNDAAVDDPGFNLYTLVWPYDQVGFGTCCGRSSLPENGGEGHTIVKGVRHARFDLSLMAADLFGWNIGTITPEIQTHLQNESDYWPLRGLSFFILPLGLAVGFRRGWLWAWLVVGLVWLVAPLVADAPFLKGYLSNTVSSTPAQIQQAKNLLWAWVGAGAVLMLIPPLGLAFEHWRAGRAITGEDHNHRTALTESTWTWLLLGVAFCMIYIHLAYWIGSQRYSTRYYYEALSALGLIGALPLAWIVRQVKDSPARPALYSAFAVLLIFTLYSYSTPRIQALYGFNMISPDLAQGVEERREGEQPVLVIVSGNDVRWRSYGSLMALTGPYLDDDIIVAWDYAPGQGVREQIIARFPERQIIELNAQANEAWFADEAPPSIGQASQ
jgi:hypothetical protein